MSNWLTSWVTYKAYNDIRGGSQYRHVAEHVAKHVRPVARYVLYMYKRNYEVNTYFILTYLAPSAWIHVNTVCLLEKNLNMMRLTFATFAFLELSGWEIWYIVYLYRKLLGRKKAREFISMHHVTKNLIFPTFMTQMSPFKFIFHGERALTKKVSCQTTSSELHLYYDFTKSCLVCSHHMQ